MFLYDYTTYIVDQSRCGRAGQSTEPYTFAARSDDQLWYNTFRIGEYPNYYAKHRAFPTKQKIIVDAMIVVFENISAGGKAGTR